MFIVKIFIAALVILAKNWKVLKNSLIVEWINKCSVFYCMIIHTNVFYCVNNHTVEYRKHNKSHKYIVE